MGGIMVSNDFEKLCEKGFALKQREKPTKILTGSSPTLGNIILFDHVSVEDEKKKETICSSAAHADKLLWTRLSCFDKILEAFERVYLTTFSDAAKSWTKSISAIRDHPPCCDQTGGTATRGLKSRRR
jgi:hypothetical protein